MPLEVVTHAAWLGVRLPEQEKNAAQAVADAQGISLSMLTRAALRAEVQRYLRKPREPRPDSHRPRAQPAWRER